VTTNGQGKIAKGSGCRDGAKPGPAARGVGMVSHSGVAYTMFKTLAEKGINILLISTSEIKISVLIAKEYGELAVRVLHDAYGLEK
jgi:aspartokinase